MLQKSFIALLAAFGTSVLLWFVGFMWFAAHVALIEPENPNSTTDAIIVLTGDKGRIDTGIRLLKEKKSEELFISGVNPDVKIEDLTSGKLIPCCITLGYMADNTEQNASESAGWIKANKIKSVRLVTSNYHMVRSKTAFEANIPDIEIIAHPVLPDDFEPTNRKFWPTIFKEYHKTIATWIKYSFIREKLS